jgi:eukaryotic translation initiation factor 2C
MPILSALNLVLAAHPTSSHGGGVMVGRNRFFFPNAMSPSDLGGGLQAFRGFYSSVRPTHNQLMVNVNGMHITSCSSLCTKFPPVCTTAFYTPGNLMDSLNAFMNASFSARANAFVKGVRVKTTHLGYKKTIKGISNHTARTYKFPCEELGGEVTVEEYFKKSMALHFYLKRC